MSVGFKLLMRDCQSQKMHHSSKYLLQKHLMGRLMPLECLSLVRKAFTQTESQVTLL